MLSAGYSWHKQHLSKQDNTRLNLASPFLLLTRDRSYNSINSLKKRTLLPHQPLLSSIAHPTVSCVHSEQHNYRSFYDLGLRPISWYCKPFKCQLLSLGTPCSAGIYLSAYKRQMFCEARGTRVCWWIGSLLPSPLLVSSAPASWVHLVSKIVTVWNAHWIFMPGAHAAAENR